MISVEDLEVGLARLKGVSLRVDAGQIVAVTGVNGAGKSTLLRCVAGLQKPDGGRVEVDTPDFWRDVAYAAEEPPWYPGLTAREHVTLTTRLHGDESRVDATLADFGVPTESSPLTLSTGQRQRLLLATVFVRPSRALVLDEPERGLDPDFRTHLGDLIRAYADSGGAVLMATHEGTLPADETVRLA